MLLYCLEGYLRKFMVGRVAQVVEYLLSKFQALCSSPSTAKKKNTKIKKRIFCQGHQNACIPY
jgi:hypothetical protein